MANRRNKPGVPLPPRQSFKPAPKQRPVSQVNGHQHRLTARPVVAPSFDDKPTMARAASNLQWSRWRPETPQQFIERVEEDARRLGVRVVFNE
jgi:hypothetical protein